MNVIGIDPGLNFMAAVLLREDGRIEFSVAKGLPIKRPTKRDPKPKQFTVYHRTRFVAVSVLSLWPASLDAVIAIEGGPGHGGKLGRQDSLAAVRQAVFDLLVERFGLASADSLFVPVAPASAKKALTDYNQADKHRMVAEALRRFREIGGQPADARFRSFGPKHQEALADALGVALAVVKFPRSYPLKDERENAGG